MLNAVRILKRRCDIRIARCFALTDRSHTQYIAAGSAE